MTGPYTFKRWDGDLGPGEWFRLPPGHWTQTSSIPGRTNVFVCCPVCHLVAGLPHAIDAAGVVSPSLQCPYTGDGGKLCSMHLMPVTLEGWTYGARPRAEAART